MSVTTLLHQTQQEYERENQQHDTLEHATWTGVIFLSIERVSRQTFRQGNGSDHAITYVPPSISFITCSDMTGMYQQLD